METINRKDVVLLFAWDYYDGPLTGALEWRGERYWFRLVSDTGDRIEYDVLSLSEGDWARVDREQALFEEHVGGHTRYDRETQRRDLSSVKSHGHCSHNPFYDRPKEEVEWSPDGAVVARMVWNVTV